MKDVGRLTTGSRQCSRRVRLSARAIERFCGERHVAFKSEPVESVANRSRHADEGVPFAFDDNRAATCFAAKEIARVNCRRIYLAVAQSPELGLDTFDPTAHIETYGSDQITRFGEQE